MALAVLAACTPGTGRLVPTVAPLSPSPGSQSIAVVASLSGPGAEADLTRVDGMRVAELELSDREPLIALSIADDRGRPARTRSLLEASLEADPAAVVVVGPGASVASARPAIEAAGVPVVLLGGDLYSARGLFRWAFQASPPLDWQARVIAHHLVADRDARRIAVVVEEGPDRGTAAVALDRALAEEGVEAASAVTLVPDADPAAAVEAIEGAEGVIHAGSAAGAAGLAAGLSAAHQAPLLTLTADGILGSFAGGYPEGTLVASPYSWGGWAEMLPRVRGFRERMEASLGTLPAGFEQEGYDTIRLLAAALERSGGRGGEALLRSLEATRGATYSALPIDLGPDDHLLPPQLQLGLFTLAPSVPAGEATGALPWRALMRTFTTDGERVSLIEEDVRVFFPGWREPEPRPEYKGSRFGDTSGPGGG